MIMGTGRILSRSSLCVDYRVVRLGMYPYSHLASTSKLNAVLKLLPTDHCFKEIFQKNEIIIKNP